jgi:hypothetical protein
MGQKFYASSDTFTWPNGATGHRPGGPFDCLGPYAKVVSCPIFIGPNDTGLRRTCYATGYADTYFSVPACTRIGGAHVAGYFSTDDRGITFRVMDRSKALVEQALARLNRRKA